MKQIISFLVFGLAVCLAFTSCKKDLQSIAIQENNIPGNARVAPNSKTLMVSMIVPLPEGSCVQWTVPKPNDPWGHCIKYSTVDAVKVTILDEVTGKPVSGATVTGNWSGAYNISGVSGRSDPNGFAEINGLSGYSGTVTFTVINVTLKGSTYDPTKNLLTSVIIR